ERYARSRSAPGSRVSDRSLRPRAGAPDAAGRLSAGSRARSRRSRRRRRCSHTRSLCAKDRRVKLKEIRTFVVGNPPPGYGGRYFLFVKLTTDGNAHGVREAYSVPFHPDLAARMAVHASERYLLGEDPHDVATLWRRAYS